MKKIFLSVLAVAALASCTKMDTAYEAPQEIGFKAVAGNMTKSAVDGENFPTTLDMYVFAETTDNTGETANYINNGQFTFKGNYNAYVNPDPAATPNPNVWGGVTPYYWPNVKKLHFSGYSKSGNVATTSTSATVSYDCTSNELSISNYSPGTSTGAGENDLMWFPCTSLTNAEGYGKETDYVSVNMYHTCSWISFMVKGDAVTGVLDDASTTNVDESSAAYVINSLKINNIDLIADVACTASKPANVIVPSIVWSNNSATDASYDVTLNATAKKLTQTPINIETNSTVNTAGNIIVIPQTPGVLELTYSYKSSTGATISEEYSVDKGNALSLAINNTNPDLNKWLPGVHYIYTITIKANEILIAPTPVDWTDMGNNNVTVE